MVLGNPRFRVEQSQNACSENSLTMNGVVSRLGTMSKKDTSKTTPLSQEGLALHAKGLGWLVHATPDEELGSEVELEAQEDTEDLQEEPIEVQQKLLSADLQQKVAEPQKISEGRLDSDKGYPTTTYSMMGLCHSSKNWVRPFRFGFLVFLSQASLLTNLIRHTAIERLPSNVAEDGTHKFLPANVDPVVKIAQYVAFCFLTRKSKTF